VAFQPSIDFCSTQNNITGNKILSPFYNQVIMEWEGESPVEKKLNHLTANYRRRTTCYKQKSCLRVNAVAKKNPQQFFQLLLNDHRYKYCGNLLFYLS
jgi:hypothetical protein